MNLREHECIFPLTFPMLPLADSFVLVTSRCLLRQPGEQDMAAIFDATRQPGFNDGMMWEPPATMDDLRTPLAEGLAAWRAGTAYNFTIEHRQTGEFLGRISIRSSTKATDPLGLWNIGFFLHPRHQGQGYMREAGRAILKLGFETLDATEIEAFHAIWNKASQSVLHALGMTFTGHFAEGFLKRGQWVAEDRVAITRSHYEASVPAMNPQWQASQ